MDVPGRSCWEGGRAGEHLTSVPARLKSVGLHRELLYHPTCLIRVVYGLTLTLASIPRKAALEFCSPGASRAVTSTQPAPLALAPCREAGLVQMHDSHFQPPWWLLAPWLKRESQP